MNNTNNYNAAEKKAYEAGFENGKFKVRLRGWAAGALVGLVISASVAVIIKNK